jgi:integrase
VKKRYSPWSVHAWFRVFRAMTRDAMHELVLERDPTLRVSFPAADEKMDPNCLEPDELAAFLAAMRAEFPHHWGLSVLLAYTGLRFCHASALRWEDWDRDRGLIRVLRKQVRGKVAPVTRKKRAPREIPVEPELAAALDEHRAMLLADQAPGLAEGWMFPSSAGTLRVPSSLYKAWRRCMDAVVRRALTGHVTERMQRHYSHVGNDEKRAALAGVLRLVPPASRHVPPKSVGTLVGTGGGGRARTHNGRRAQRARRPDSFERDTGVEPATFSLGS